MKPVPVVFHIGPLQVHTYGIGLALTFWFGFVYFERRLKKNGYPTEWLVPVFLWIILAAVVGARALHVLTNLSYYTANPGDVFAIWHGGLSSFGGLLFAVPTGILLTRRRCPELPLGRALDLVLPVLLACWALGRLLGPQLMVAGGGHPTHQWFGMYYAGQTGKRLPVPIFQALEDFTVYLILILIERALDRWPDGSRAGGLPARDRARHGDDPVGHRALARRAPLARGGRPPRLGPGPAGGHPAGRRRRRDSAAHAPALARMAAVAPRSRAAGAPGSGRHRRSLRRARKRRSAGLTLGAGSPRDRDPLEPGAAGPAARRPARGRSVSGYCSCRCVKQAARARVRSPWRSMATAQPSRKIHPASRQGAPPEWARPPGGGGPGRFVRSLPFPFSLDN